MPQALFGIDRVVRALRPQDARRAVGDEVDGLLALLGVGERRHADVEGAALNRRDDLGEVRLAVFRRQAERRGDRVHQIDVEADDLAAFVLELVGRVGNVDADDQFPGRLDVLGHGVRDFIDLLGRRRRCPGGRRARFGARVGAARAAR